MMNLAEYRRKGTRLADYLPWAALVAPGVVLNKDGSFQRRASSLKQAGEAMGGVDWMTWREIVESIPPSYTEWIAQQYDHHLDELNNL